MATATAGRPSLGPNWLLIGGVSLVVVIVAVTLVLVVTLGGGGGNTAATGGIEPTAEATVPQATPTDTATAVPTMTPTATSVPPTPTSIQHALCKDLYTSLALKGKMILYSTAKICIISDDPPRSDGSIGNPVHIQNPESVDEANALIAEAAQVIRDRGFTKCASYFVRAKDPNGQTVLWDTGNHPGLELVRSDCQK